MSLNPNPKPNIRNPKPKTQTRTLGNPSLSPHPNPNPNLNHDLNPNPNPNPNYDPNSTELTPNPDRVPYPQEMYEFTAYQMFNTIFTSLPIILYGVYDMDVKNEAA